MCGRYGRTTSASDFAKIVGAAISPRLDDAVSYNRPPGTFQLCGLIHPDTGELTLGPAWWGFVPNWATDTKVAPINARSETADDKKLFAKAFRRQRCLVAVDWWYEWRRDGDHKQPYAIRPRSSEPFFFAGLWSKAGRLPSDHAAAGRVTFAILTGTPSEDIAHIHNGQPQALTQEAALAWLSTDETEPEQLHHLLDRGRYTDYDSWPISSAVGSPANDYPEIIERVGEPGSG